MRAIEVKISLHPGQLAVWQHAARFRVLSGGRRWGKTWLGCALCFDTALRGGRAWWIAPSYPMSNVGWRGLNELRRQMAQVLPIGKHQMERLLSFPGGGEVRVKSADNPDGLRGDGLDLAVLDECAYMKPEAWTEALRPALSDRRGAALFISTPHGLNWFRDLWLRGQDSAFPDWQSWTFKTGDNPFIAPDEIEAARQMLSSRIFRQEYEADFLTDNPGALWKREWIDAGRSVKAPDFATVAVAMDPAATGHGDACGIIAGGMAVVDGQQHLYVLEDATLTGSPDEQARAAVTLYHKIGADSLIVETNQGGEWLKTVLRQVDPTVRVVEVHASRGKLTRAEPVSALYEQGRGHHVGAFPLLEDELCQWEVGNASPNRLDALVWLAAGIIAGGPPAAGAVAQIDPRILGGGTWRERQNKNRRLGSGSRNG